MPKKHENRATNSAFAGILENDFDKSNTSELLPNYQPLSGSTPTSRENLAFYYDCRKIHPILNRQFRDHDTTVPEDV